MGNFVSPDSSHETASFAWAVPNASLVACRVEPPRATFPCSADGRDANGQWTGSTQFTTEDYAMAPDGISSGSISPRRCAPQDADMISLQITIYAARRQAPTTF